MSEGLGVAADGVGATGRGGLAQASERLQRWLHEEIETALHAGLPPPMTVVGGSQAGAFVLPPSLSSLVAGGAAPSVAPLDMQAPWLTRPASGAPRPQPAEGELPLAGDVVVVRGSATALGRQAALSSAEHGATLLLVDPLPLPAAPLGATDGAAEVRRMWQDAMRGRAAATAREAGAALVAEVRARYASRGADAVYVQVARQPGEEPKIGEGDEWSCSVQRIKL